MDPGKGRSRAPRAEEQKTAKQSGNTTHIEQEQGSDQVR